MILAAAVWTSSAHGQVNAEVMARNETPGLSLTLAGAAGLSAGNVASVWWKGDGLAQSLTIFPEPAPEEDKATIPPFLRDRVMLFGRVNRASYSNEVVDDDALAHLRLTHMQWRHFGGELFVQLQYGRFWLLQRRLLAGGGVRIDIIHLARVGLWGGSGLMFEEESLSDGTDTLALRSTSYLSSRAVIVPEHLSLINTVYLQPRVDLPSDFRLLDEMRLDVTVLPWLSIGTDLSLRHDSRPPDGILRTDVRLGSSFKLTLQHQKPTQAP